MNYINIYKNIVKNAQNRNLEGYKEVHHIKPRCMGGKDTEDNLVDLTAREHFICHILLVKIYPNSRKLKNAFWAMASMKNKYQERYRCSSRVFEIARKSKSEAMRGHKHSDITKNKISSAKKGKKMSVETRTKMSVAASLRAGENSSKFKGYFCTPAGKFASTLEAANANDCCSRSIRNWCKSGKNGYSFIAK